MFKVLLLLGVSASALARDVADGEAQFAASIHENGRHQCSGTIIEKNWLITSAHCVDPGKAGTYKIKFGTNNSDGKNMISVSKVIHHPKYTLAERAHDLALIKLNGNIPASAKTLALSDEDLDNDDELVMFGWDSNGPNHKLQEVNTRGLDNGDCEFYGFDDLYCMIENGKGQFIFGDAGGPVMGPSKKLDCVLYGTFEKSKSRIVGACVTILNNIDWINDTIKKN